MGAKKWDTAVNAAATVTHDSASAIVVDANTDDLYFYVDRITMSIYKACIGDNGILEMADTDGNVFYTTSVEGVKDFVIDVGNEGYRVGQNQGLQILVSGASTQASVSLIVVGHYNID